ncbi:hypothetical protein CLOM_g15565 [Closterium sp. NIES-68]|nr:hypothetical protein CLOM_g15565 [Closterium sp. NIES-68]
MLKVRQSLGLTDASWNWKAGVACTLPGEGLVAGTVVWKNVVCDSNGNPIVIRADGLNLAGGIPSAIKNMTAITRLELQNNAFNRRLDAFMPNLLALTNLAQLNLRDNFFYGSIPTSLLAMKSLQKLSLSYNFLSGAVPPAFSSSLLTLDVDGNLLLGTFPMPPTLFEVCSAVQNCLRDVEMCDTGLGTEQKPSRDCTVCGVNLKAPDAADPCGSGNTCAPVVTDPKNQHRAKLPMQCVGPDGKPVDSTGTGAGSGTDTGTGMGTGTGTDTGTGTGTGLGTGTGSGTESGTGGGAGAGKGSGPVGGICKKKKRVKCPKNACRGMICKARVWSCLGYKCVPKAAQRGLH